MSTPLLNVDNLTKIYYSGRKFFLFKQKIVPKVAVKHLSFELHEGEILGILGANGAGKTTLIEMLLGVLTPTSGTISYFGKNFSNHKSEILQSIGQASAYHKLPTSLTVQENLEIIGRLYSIPIYELRKRITSLLEEFDMIEYRKTPTANLSAGQLTQILLIKAFLSNPKILLLDEPTASLDPDVANDVRRYILRHQRERKLSIILTSHNMKEVSEVCDRVLVMQNGKLIRQDSPSTLAKENAMTTVILRIPQQLDKAIAIAKMQQFHIEVMDEEMKTQMDETKVSSFLRSLAQQNIDFTHIEIQKPSLEDYFLTLSKRSA